MQVKIIEVQKVYEAPPAIPNVYRVTVTFHNQGIATFNQSFVVAPRVGETWEMAEPRLTRITHYPDGSER